MHFMTLQEAGYAVIGLIVLFSVNLAITGAAQFLERRRFFRTAYREAVHFPGDGSLFRAARHCYSVVFLRVRIMGDDIAGLLAINLYAPEHPELS